MRTNQTTRLFITAVACVAAAGGPQAVAFCHGAKPRRSQVTCATLVLKASSFPNGDDNNNDDPIRSMQNLVQSDQKRSTLFSVAMTLSGAALGPFLDAYHSAFGVLEYDQPITAILWGSPEFPALTTAWWVPELFGLAGFLIGWLYILLDHVMLPANNSENNDNALRQPSVPKILIGISFFTAQYWLSGIMYSSGVDRTAILNAMSLFATIGFVGLDLSPSGFATSAATAVGGPLIEMGLIRVSQTGLIQGGYHYTDLGETGFFPLWIVPVYFLGGPAVGNLARGIWSGLTTTNYEPTSFSKNNPDKEKKKEADSCTVCLDSRRVPCPNCDGVGEYMAMGNRMVSCASCRGSGMVICRTCFQDYDEDPWDIEAIREKMSRLPD